MALSDEKIEVAKKLQGKLNALPQVPFLDQKQKTSTESNRKKILAEIDLILQGKKVVYKHNEYIGIENCIGQSDLDESFDRCVKKAEQFLSMKEQPLGVAPSDYMHLPI